MRNRQTLIQTMLLLTLAVLPPLTSSQSKFPEEWKDKQATQIVIKGSPIQLKAFQSELESRDELAFVKKLLDDKTIIQWPTSGNKLGFTYLTETEKELGKSILLAFAAALEAATEKTKYDKRLLQLGVSYQTTQRCRPKNCAGQQALGGPYPECDCP